MTLSATADTNPSSTNRPTPMTSPRPRTGAGIGGFDEGPAAGAGSTLVPDAIGGSVVPERAGATALPSGRVGGSVLSYIESSTGISACATAALTLETRSGGSVVSSGSADGVNGTSTPPWPMRASRNSSAV
jgi:hypothetical protein